MSLIDYLLSLHREADGTSVSRLEWERLQVHRKQAVAACRLNPADASPGIALENQQRDDRMRHIGARLYSARGHSDFNRSAFRGQEREA